MSKERLEEIKQIRNDMEEYINPDGSVEDYPRYDELALFIIDDYLDYLIEQAERVQDLEGELTYYKMATESYLSMEQENKRYRGALEFYANEDNFTQSESEYFEGYPPEVMNDRGYKARKALEREG